jgi:uncharacterized protein involved in exopolysaccharide biosynthesis
MAKGGAKILFGLFFTLILAGGLAGGGAWYLTEHRVEGYRATALLLLEPGTTPTSGVIDPSSDPLRARIESALGIEAKRAVHAGIAAPDYAVLFQSDDMANQLKAKLEAIQAEKGITTPAPTLEQVRASMKAETQVALQTTSNVVYSQTIQLHFTAANPEVAAVTANAWGELCAAQANALVAKQRDAREAPLNAALETARAALTAATQKQADLRAAGHLETLESAATEGAKALEELKETIRQLEGSAARDGAALAALKTYVSKAPPAVALELAVKEADAESAMAGAKAESEYAAAKLAEVQAAQAEAQGKWAQASREQNAADAEVDRLALEVRALEESLRDARGGTAVVSVASPAIAPTAPVGPHRYVIVAGATVLGALFGLIAYFGLLTLRVYARALDRG